MSVFSNDSSGATWMLNDLRTDRRDRQRRPLVFATCTCWFLEWWREETSKDAIPRFWPFHCSYKEHTNQFGNLMSEFSAWCIRLGGRRGSRTSPAWGLWQEGVLKSLGWREHHVSKWYPWSFHSPKWQVSMKLPKGVINAGYVWTFGQCVFRCLLGKNAREVSWIQHSLATIVNVMSGFYH